MTDVLNDLNAEIREIVRRIRVLESASPLGWSSISEGALEIRSAEGLIVIGTSRIDGTQYVDGRLEGSGVFDWTGPLFLRGNTGITGILQVTGATTLAGTLVVSGSTTLNSTLTLGSGRIDAGAVTITPSGGGAVEVGNLRIDGDLGGSITSSGTVYIQGTGTTSVRVTGMLSASDLLVLGKITAGELDVVGPKNFRMEHPTKAGHWLRHGSTESPVSGTEYTGRVTLDAAGEGVVELPDYFEALNKPQGRTVQLTPVGRPFPVGADEVEDGKVTVYGDPGRDVFWLVKAERYGGDFLLEEEMPEPEEEQQ